MAWLTTVLGVLAAAGGHTAMVWGISRLRVLVVNKYVKGIVELHL
jgi:hypothetical protein